MDPVTGAALISAGSNLLGGLFGRSKDGKADRAAALQYAHEKEFAQNAIQWKAADAKAAGLHPLAALGASTASPSPISVGSGDSGMGNAISDMGQNLGRAVQSYMSKDERLKKDALDNLTLEKAKLQNDILRGQATAINRSNSPGFPTAVASVNGDVQYNPDQITRSRSSDSSTTAAQAKPAVTEFLNRDGSTTTWPSPEAKNAVEDSLYEYEHMYRNRIAPWLQRRGAGLANFRPSRYSGSYSGR